MGNAKILGLQADTHMTDHEYAIGLCAFYATYIARYEELQKIPLAAKLTMCSVSFPAI